ncbi:MAG: glycoside hydrolase family 95-like protein, partial [Victivallaceae bacterium]
LQNYGGHTGWSRAWAACLWAAFGEGEKAYECLENLIAHQSSDSLLDLHPPKLFQIDGNFGAAAATLEMLLKTENGIMIFLPALPPEFRDGAIQKFHVRGGFVVNFSWENGLLREAEIIPQQNSCCSIKAPGENYAVFYQNNIIARFDNAERIASFPSEPGEKYYIRAVITQ